MPIYNFLTGSSVKNTLPQLFETFKNEECYLGFARGEIYNETLTINQRPNFQWGASALVQVSFLPNVVFSNVVAKTGDVAATPKFFDTNSFREINDNTLSNTVKIYRTLKSPNLASPVLMFDTETIKATYIGEHWMLLTGLPRNYFDVLTYSATYKYLIVKDGITVDFSVAGEIVEKQNYLNTADVQYCYLFNKTDNEIVVSNLQKITTPRGETFVSGLRSLDSITTSDNDYIFKNVADKNSLKSKTFTLLSNSGKVIIDTLSYHDLNTNLSNIFSDQVSTNGNYTKTEFFISFDYNTNNIQSQIKFFIGNRELRDLAIWNELLPFDTINPVSDENPFRMEPSLIKNNLLVDSIFDVKGMAKINLADVWFVRELNTTAEVEQYTNTTSTGGYGFALENMSIDGYSTSHSGIIREDTTLGDLILYLEPYHTFIVGDVFVLNSISYTIDGVSYDKTNSFIHITSPIATTLPINYVLSGSNPNGVSVVSKFAKTQDYKRALKYGFDSIMLDKQIDYIGANSPTEDVYRQLFIVSRPKDKDGVEMTNAIYKGSDYTTNEIFNKTTRTYDLGNLLYIANKTPVYRKYFYTAASPKEVFKLII